MGMSTTAIDEKQIGPQAITIAASLNQYIQELEDIDFVVDDVSKRISTPLLRSRNQDLSY